MPIMTYVPPTVPIVPIYHLQKNDLFKVGRTEYRYKDTDETGYWFGLASDPDAVEHFTFAQYFELSRQQRFEFERNWHTVERATTRGPSSDELLSRLSPEERRTTQFKFELCTLFIRLEARDDFNRSDASLAVFFRHATLHFAKLNNADAKQGGDLIIVPRMPSARTFRKWLKTLHDGAYHAYSLRPSKRGKSAHQKRTLSQEDREFMAGYVVQYADAGRPTKRSLFEACRNAALVENAKRMQHGLPPLKHGSWPTFHAMIDDLDKFDVMAAREGIDKAKRLFGIVGDGFYASRIGEIVQADDFRVPLITLLKSLDLLQYMSADEIAKVKRTRSWAGLMIDAATRCILGFRQTTTPTTAHALDILRQSMVDKSDWSRALGCQSDWPFAVGASALWTDHGSNFNNEMFRGALIDFDIRHLMPEEGEPRGRAIVERVIGTVQSGAYGGLAGRTFGSIAEKGDYNPGTSAVHVVAEAERIALRYIVDHYHHRPHAGLGGETPYNAWRRLSSQGVMVPPPSTAKRRAVLGISRTAKLQPMGVQFLGLWFVAPEFQDYVKRRGFEEVELRLDPTDIGTISVKLSDNWIVASARDPKFHGMPLFEWLDTLKELERRYGHEARIAAPLVHAARQEIRRTDIDARMRAGHEGREEIQANIDRAAKHLPRGFQIFEDRDALQTADTDPLARRVKAAPKPSALRDQSPADKTAAFQLPSSNEDVHNKDDDVDDGGKVL